jgi:hypothetical protein
MSSYGSGSKEASSLRSQYKGKKNKAHLYQQCEQDWLAGPPHVSIRGIIDGKLHEALCTSPGGDIPQMLDETYLRLLSRR